MTEEQREMCEFLAGISKRVERGEIAGIAIAFISPQKAVQSAFLGACGREPIQTLGITRLMARLVEDSMFSPEPQPTPEQPSQGPQKS